MACMLTTTRVVGMILDTTRVIHFDPFCDATSTRSNIPALMAQPSSSHGAGDVSSCV